MPPKVKVADSPSVKALTQVKTDSSQITASASIVNDHCNISMSGKKL
jgi:hypothetical protein